MAKKSMLTPGQRTQRVLRLVGKEEPAVQIARRAGISEQAPYRWREAFLSGGKQAMAGRGSEPEQAKELKRLSGQIAERDRVIGEPTIANRILKKLMTTVRPWVYPNGRDGREQLGPSWRASRPVLTCQCRPAARRQPDGRSAAAPPAVAGRHLDKAWMSGYARAYGQGIGNIPVADPLPTLIHPLPTCRRIGPAVASGLFNNNRFFYKKTQVPYIGGGAMRRPAHGCPMPWKTHTNSGWTCPLDFGAKTGEHTYATASAVRTNADG